MNDYRTHEGISYSALQNFYHGTPEKDLGIQRFLEIGKMFELKVQREINGLDYELPYIVTEKELTDDQFKLHNLNDLEISEQFEKMKTKDGSWNKTYKDKPAILSEIASALRQGKILMSIADFNLVDNMVNNFLTLKVSLWSEEVSVFDLLKNAKWQYPVYKDGKKALFDYIANVHIYGLDWEIPIDIKSTFELSRFPSMYYSKYWIQDRHYLSLIEDYDNPSNKVYSTMQFLAQSSSEPFLAQQFKLNPEKIDIYQDRYENLLNRYIQWVNNGKPQITYLPIKEL